MAAASSAEIVSGAPGVTTIVPGSGLTGGAGASVKLAGQGADGSLTTTIANPVFASDGSSVSFVTPDGARDGELTITASDTTTTSLPLRVNSQYVFSSEFIGQGADTSSLVPGELDAILQQASAYADAYLSQGGASTLRLLQTTEQARYKKRTRRVYPRRRPIVTLDSFTYIASPSLQVQFDPNTFIIVPDLEYVELVVWSMGYTLVQALASFTMYDAGINTITYTAGYPFAEYPQALREAVKIIATELLTYRNIEASGFGGLARVKQGQVQYDRRNEPFQIPDPALVFLNQLRFVRPA